MGLGKTYSTSYLADSNNNTGEDGQVLISTATGINWVDGSGVTGGPFLPLSAGAGFPLTDALSFSITPDTSFPSASIKHNSNGYVYFSGGANGALFGNSNQQVRLQANATNMEFLIGGTTKAIIASTGNVGIGTTSPNSKLHVSDTTNISMSGGSAGQVAIEGNGYTGAIALDATAMHIYHNSGARDLVLGTNETARLTISGSSGNVGIGTASPAATLHISKGSNNSPTVLRIENVDTTIETAQEVNTIQFYTNDGSASGTGITSKIVQVAENPGNQYGLSFYTYDIGLTEALRITNDGKVGIGTTAPAAKLEVYTSSYSANNAIANFVNGNNPIRVSYDTVVVAQQDVPCLSIVETIDGTQANEQKLTLSVGDARAVIGSSSTATEGIYINTNRATNAPGYNQTLGTNVARFLNNGNAIFPGNVGIGTTSPSEKLEVDGNVQIGSTTDAKLYMVSTGGNGNNERFFIEGYADGGTYGGGFKLSTRNDVNVFNTAVTVNRNGNVGIGTTSPIGNLNINGGTGDAVAQDSVLNLTRTSSTGNVYSAKLRLVEGASTTHGDLRFQVKTTASSAENSSYYTDAITIKGNTANVGIGTTSPTNLLSLRKDVAGGDVAIYLQNYNSVVGSTDETVSIKFAHGNDSGSGYVGAKIVGGKEGDFESNPANVKGFMSFYTNEGSLTSQVEQMRINGDGNVGIGTTSPSGKLEVSDTTTGIAAIIGNTTHNSRLQIYTAAVGKNSEIWFGDAADDDIGKIDYDHADNSMAIVTNNSRAITIDSAGDVGIGETSPTFKLEVKDPTSGIATIQVRNDEGTDGSGAGIRLYTSTDTYGNKPVYIKNIPDATGAALVINSRAADNSYSDTFYISGYGDVGIGTTSPDSKLDVKGPSATPADGNQTLSITNSTGGTQLNLGTAENSYGWIEAREGSTLRNLLINPNGGNVGIGTTSPGAKLHIFSSATSSFDQAIKLSSNPGVGGGSAVFFKTSGADTDDRYGVKLGAVRSDSDNGSSVFKIQQELSNTSGALLGLSDTFIIDQYGRAGIGLSQPIYKLHVAGTFRASGNSSIGGKLGIGTADPQAQLEIRNNEAGDGVGGATLRLTRGDSTSVAGDPVGTIEFYSTDADTAKVTAYIKSMSEELYGREGSLAFGVSQTINTDATEVMRINDQGNVGIGTTNPNARLNVKSTDSTTDQITLTHSGNTVNVVAIGQESSHGSLVLRANSGVNKVRLSAAGNNSYILDSNVGIGTTAPGQKLSVDGNIQGYADAYLGANKTSGETILQLNNYDPALTDAEDIQNVIKMQGRYWSGNSSQLIQTEIRSVKERSNGNGDSGLAFATQDGGNGPSERMRIAHDGNVGIGTTSPNKKLVVSENGSKTAIGSSEIIRVAGTAQAVGNRNEIGFSPYDNNYNPHITLGMEYVSTAAFCSSDFYIATRALTTDTAPLERMRITSTGNVGIGTTAPATKLNIDLGSGGTNGVAGLRIGATSNYASLELGIYGAYGGMVRSYGNDLHYFSGHWRTIGNTASENHSHYWYTSKSGSSDWSTVKMELDHNGNLGIGTTSPSQKLDVNGDIAVKGVSIINKASAALTIGDTAGTDSVTNLTLTTAGRNTEVFLDDAGNVGINTATPSYNLTVNSGTNDIGILTASSDSGSYVGFLDNSTSTIPKIGAVGNKLILDASQYVGIKRTDPSYALDVSGTIRATGDVIAYSDARVKENVETIPNALDKVKAMRGVGYNKIGEEKRSIGVIAQEMLEVMPEAVHKDDSGMYSVAYGNLVGVLIEAMKDQQAQIDELKARLNGSTK
jgi:hypothetical protein